MISRQPKLDGRLTRSSQSIWGAPFELALVGRVTRCCSARSPMKVKSDVTLERKAPNLMPMAICGGFGRARLLRPKSDCRSTTLSPSRFLQTPCCRFTSAIVPRICLSNHGRLNPGVSSCGMAATRISSPTRKFASRRPVYHARGLPRCGQSNALEHW